MFTYQQNKSAECQECPVEQFKRLTQSPQTAATIVEHRRLMACGKVAEAKKIKDSLPGCLYQTKEVLVSLGDKKYNKGKMGRWRLQSQCVLNGLVMCDFDHVGKDPRKVYEEAVKKLSSEDVKAILLAFITPGGEGLKTVSIADINYNLVDNQKNLAKKLGLAIKIDKGCKDSSRLSYIPKWDDILYINEKELFEYDNPLYDEKYGRQYREGNSQGSLDFGDSTQGTDTTVPCKQSTDESQSLCDAEIKLDKDENGVYCYHGVPYKDLLAKWWELKGGKPGIGDRHQRMLELVFLLRPLHSLGMLFGAGLQRQTHLFVGRDDLVLFGSYDEGALFLLLLLLLHEVVQVSQVHQLLGYHLHGAGVDLLELLLFC